jgi:hypothetical protein
MKNEEKSPSKHVFKHLFIITFFASILLLCVVMGFNREVNYILLIVIVAVSCIVSFFYGRSKQPDQWIELFDTEHNYSIYKTLLDIFRRNMPELITITIIGIIFLFIFAFLLEGYSKIKPSSLAPITIGLLLSFASVIITVVGMFYAFLAERRAHKSEKMSEKSLKKSIELLAEKGDFLEHFSGFINRINRKLDEDKRGIISDVSLDQKNEEYFYHIKCMFLTPFLAHAGVTANNKAMFDSFYRFQANIEKLIESNFCEVKILTLDPEKLVKWYAQIQWIEEVKKKIEEIRSSISDDKEKDKVSFRKSFGDVDKKKVVENVKKTLVEEKGLGFLKMTGDLGEVSSFSLLKNQYSAKYSGTKADNQPKLKIFHTDYIPFQIFLVMKRKSVSTNTNPTDTERSGVEELEGKFVVLTFVGDRTYLELIKDIIKDQHYRNGGIDDLLINLHSAFYSEDPRICKILNNHFDHYWDASESDKHYPRVDDNLWENVNLYDEDCLTEGCKSSNL